MGWQVERPVLSWVIQRNITGRHFYELINNYSKVIQYASDVKCNLSLQPETNSTAAVAAAFTIITKDKKNPNQKTVNYK